MSESNLVVCRFCRVPFGLICSPFLLGATLKFPLKDEGSPLALNILNNMYVDNGNRFCKRGLLYLSEGKDHF